MDDRTLRRALDGRTVALTGASSGIGRATALRLGRVGAHVALVARRRAELETVAGQLPRASVHPCDLTDAEATDALCAKLREDGVDVLVSNAGHSIRRTLERSRDAARDAERLTTLNYLAPVRLIAGLLAQLIERGGQVVCVSSIAAQAGAPGFAAYAASKSALDTYVRCVAAERGTGGIAFTTVNMPLVRTPMVEPSPDLTAGMPAISAERAAELIASAIVHRPRRIGTPAGELAAIGWALDPAVTVALDRRLRPRNADGANPADDGGDGGAGWLWPLQRLVRLATTMNVRR